MDSLLDEVKDYLKITWNDEDDNLRKIIERGRNNFNNLTGTNLDFNSENLAKSLLLDYCRYAYNNCLEYFEENFLSQITRLQYTEGLSYDNQKKQIKNSK